MDTPYDMVAGKYKLPFDLYPFQQDVVNELAPFPKAGYYVDTGCGKTSISTVSALFKIMTGEVDHVVVIMPPILLQGWRRWLSKIPDITTLVYRGTPAQRKAMVFDTDFILVGYQIFKQDHDRFMKELFKKKIVIIADEATAIKNVASQTNKLFREFEGPHETMLLTGTPITSPADTYAYVKLVAPSIYRNQNHFNNVHVAERDFFDKVSKWQNLDLMAENLKVNSVRILKEEVLHDLPPVTYTPLHYDLDPKHLKLYRQLAEQQILKLESGGKIDATNSSALYHALQQIVVNYDHFSGNPDMVSEAFRMVEQVLDEVGGKKLVVFGQYRMTNRKLLALLKPYGAVAAFGDNTVTQNQASVDKFIDDPKIQVFIGQPQSVGYGVDGLQKVCNEALFIETPTVPRDFHQAVARLHRLGLGNALNIRIGIAEGTVQARLHQQLLANDALANVVQRGFKDLREAIYGS